MKVFLCGILASMVVLSGPSGAVEWQNLGLDGVQASSLTYEQGRLWVTEGFGVHYRDIGGGDWVSHLDPMAIPMYSALTTYRPDPDRIVLGGETPVFTGYFAVSGDLGENVQFVSGAAGGRVTAFSQTSFSADDHIFAVTTNSEGAVGHLFRSRDGGFSWTTISGHMQTSLSAVVALDSNEVWVSGDAQVTRTLDGGQTWESFRGNLNPALSVRCLWGEPQIVGIPDKGGRVSAAGPLYASNNEGLFTAFPDTAVWRQILPVPCAAVAVQIGFESWLFWNQVVAVTTDGRVLYGRSLDDYQVWEDWTPGIAPATPIDVALGASAYVLTRQSGVFSTVLPPSNVPEAGAGLVLSAFPNPFNPRTTFSFDVATAGWCELAVFDLQGRRVATLQDGEIGPGPLRVPWQPRDLASGVYLARLILPEGAATRRVVLLK